MLAGLRQTPTLKRRPPLEEQLLWDSHEPEARWKRVGHVDTG